MAITQKLQSDEINLLEVVEDPILFGEFMRNTTDGSAVTEEWPRRKFTYRWYQKDILSDYNPRIVWRAGRAVGKCQPASETIYTTEGYKKISEYVFNRKDALLVLWSWNEEENRYETKRARLTYDGMRIVKVIRTVEGESIRASLEHPFWTPRGWIEASQLTTDDQIAAVNYLPWESSKNTFTWFELRTLGYLSASMSGSSTGYVPIKNESQLAEFRAIAKHFERMVLYHEDSGMYQLAWQSQKHMVNGNCRLVATINDARNLERAKQPKHLYRLYKSIMQERLENIKIFLEPYFGMMSYVHKGYLRIRPYRKSSCEMIKELLLRFGIVSEIELLPKEDYTPHDQSFIDAANTSQYVNELEDIYHVVIKDMRDIVKFYSSFELPGIVPKNLIDVEPRTELYRWIKIDSITKLANSSPVYALFVQDNHTYVSSNLIVHNSLTLEDLMIWESVNHDISFPETKEQLLTTANMNQITPVMDRLILRFSNSEFLKHFRASINRSKGTLDITLGIQNYRINARIAGSTGDSNVVGMHVHKIKIDEGQLYPWESYMQVTPGLNTWEPGHKLLITGVPNGATNGNVLWHTDQKDISFKRYHIPAHENPYFTQEDDISAKNAYGGEDSDLYKQLILGEHGSPTVNIIPRETIGLEAFDFYTYRYNQTDKQQGYGFKDKLKFPAIPEKLRKTVVFAIDTGFADPTIISVLGFDDIQWRPLARYRLTRIGFPEQAQIIDWLDAHWNPLAIGIDSGAGGQGISLIQTFTQTYPKSRRYEERIHPVNFGGTIEAGSDPNGNPLKMQVKSWAGNQLAKMIQDKELIFSEIDMECVNELERVSYTRRADGGMKFYVASEKGGESGEDHIFASFVVFMSLLHFIRLEKPKKTKLFSGRWANS